MYLKLVYALVDCASFSVLTLPSFQFYSLYSDVSQVMKYDCLSENMQVCVKESFTMQDSVCILFWQHECQITSFSL